MSSRHWIAAGALWAGLAVALGAFGAHALEPTLEQAGTTELWRTAVRYQLWHALALILFGLLQERRGGGSAPGWAFLSGSLVFSGTVYALALGAPRWFGAITPIGGTALLVAWVLFALRALRAQP